MGATCFNVHRLRGFYRLHCTRHNALPDEQLYCAHEAIEPRPLMCSTKSRNSCAQAAMNWRRGELSLFRTACEECSARLRVFMAVCRVPESGNMLENRWRGALWLVPGTSLMSARNTTMIEMPEATWEGRSSGIGSEDIIDHLSRSYNAECVRSDRQEARVALKRPGAALSEV